MSNATLSGADFNIPAISPIEVGLYNFFSWALLIVTLFAVITGYGRHSMPDSKSVEQDK
jgi:Na+/H+ antiporter NhaC